MRLSLIKTELEALKPLINKIRSQLFTLEQRKEVLEYELKRNTNRDGEYEEETIADNSDIGNIKNKEEKSVSPDLSKLSSYK